MKNRILLVLLLTFLFANNSFSQLFIKTVGNDKYIPTEYKVDDFGTINISHAFTIIDIVKHDYSGYISSIEMSEGSA